MTESYYLVLLVEIGLVVVVVMEELKSLLVELAAWFCDHQVLLVLEVVQVLA